MRQLHMRSLYELSPKKLYATRLSHFAKPSLRRERPKEPLRLLDLAQHGLGRGEIQMLLTFTLIKIFEGNLCPIIMINITRDKICRYYN